MTVNMPVPTASKAKFMGTFWTSAMISKTAAGKTPNTPEIAAATLGLR